MITARRLHAAAAAQGPQPEPPPPALVPYAQHQAALRELAQKYEAQLRETVGSVELEQIRASFGELEEQLIGRETLVVRYHAYALELEQGVGALQARVAELEEQLAERETAPDSVSQPDTEPTSAKRKRG